MIAGRPQLAAPDKDWRPGAPRVVVVGGGLAGLAAALAAQDMGLRVTLIESRPRLGGRASSFPDPKSGALADNGQHIALGCCTNFADFCRRIGVNKAGFRLPRAIRFLMPDGRAGLLKFRRLPAPFHLAPSFLGLPFLTVGDKLRIARGASALLRDFDPREGESFADWLIRHGQTVRTLSLFWGPVLISALNEQLDRLDPLVARKVIVEGLLAARDAGRPVIPDLPLQTLLGDPAGVRFVERGGELRLTAGVRSVELDDELGLQGIRLRDGSFVPADFVVLAVPWYRVEDLLGAKAFAACKTLGGLARLDSAPIVGVHLWFDRPVWPSDHAVTPGRLVHWVFKERQPEGATGDYLKLVISAARDLGEWDRGQVEAMVLEDLAGMEPRIREAKVVACRVVTEHRATFVPDPGASSARPPQRTAIDGLMLAGDWTATGWPATMEGAIRGGYLAAEEVARDLGRPVRFLQPELRADWLARALFPSLR